MNMMEDRSLLLDGLLTPQEVRQRLTNRNPKYGQKFTDADWDQIAERLAALARLLWRMSLRECDGNRRKKVGADEGKLKESRACQP
jgi:hypothetical protein